MIPDIEEIWNVVKKMNSLKSPRHDGMPAAFYKKYWKIIKGKLTQAIQNIFSIGYLLQQWNANYISLIPKKWNSNSSTDFRQINLTDVSYKIISKLIANKLNPLLHRRPMYISENVVMDQEIQHALSKAKSKKA